MNGNDEIPDGEFRSLNQAVVKEEIVHYIGLE